MGMSYPYMDMWASMKFWPQLAIYKHDRGVELKSTEKQLQLSGQSGTWTRDLRISSRAP